MRAFFDVIKTRINQRVPQIKTVRMFNDQINKRDVERTEKPFPHPACFVEFIVESEDNRSFGITDYIMIVRFRLSRVSEKFERFETFDFIDNFHGSIQMMAPTSDLNFTFTTFQGVQTDFDENHNNVENPVRDYRTRLRWSPKNQLTNGEIVTINPIVTATKVSVI